MMTMSPETGPEPIYRWVIVLTTAAMLAIAMGVMVNGITVFFNSLQFEFRWDRGSVSLINFSGLVGLALGGIVMGRVAGRTTARRVSLFGAGVFGICMLSAAHADALWQLCGLFFVAGFLGAGALFAPLIANVGNWFRSGAGLALGITAAGQALGQGGIPFGTTLLIDAFGWRGALTAIGVIAVFILVPLAMLIRQPPAPVDVSASSRTDSTDPATEGLPTNVVIIWLSAAVLFCCMCMSVPLMHLVPLIQDCGYTAEEASSVAFLMLTVAIAGRIAFGKLADRIGAVPAYWIASLWQTVLVIGFIQLQGLNGFYVFAAIFGFGYAGVMTGLLVTVRSLIPASKRASALGVVMAFAWLGHGIGGHQGGYFFDMIGDYSTSYAVAALGGLMNLVIVSLLYFVVSYRVNNAFHASA
jgi:MFS family permease